MELFMRFMTIVLSVLLLSSVANAGARKVIHIIDIPIIDAAGIYTAAKVFNNADLVSTKASAGTSMGLLAVQSAFGALTMAKLDQKKPAIRKIHRALSFALTGASVWMAVSTSLDDGTKGRPEQFTSYVFGGAVLIPVIMFSF